MTMFSFEEPNKDLEVAMSLYWSLTPASPGWAVSNTMGSWDNFNCSEAARPGTGRQPGSTMPRMLIIPFSFERREQSQPTQNSWKHNFMTLEKSQVKGLCSDF